MATELRPARERVAAVGRRLSDAGLVVGSAGNISARVGELLAVTPTGASLESLTADQVAVVDMAGEQVAGELVPTSELDLHLGIYRCYRAGAVVHTHGPLATALSCVLDELPVVHYQMLALGGAVRIVPYATFGTRELAEATLEALRDRSAALLSNHGAVVHAVDLDTAFDHTLLLEWACRIYWQAAAIGTPRTLDAEQQAAFLDAMAERRYGGVRRRSEGES